MSEKQRSMSDILQEVKTLREVASRDPINYGATGPAIAAAARQAKDDLVKLEAEYAELVKKNALAIFLTGNADQSKFAQIAQEEFGTVNVDAMDLYRRIGAYIDPGMGPGREFNSHQAGQMIAALREVGTELGLREMVAPRHPVLPVVLKDAAAVNDYVRSVIRTAVGEDLNRSYLNHTIRQKALAAEHENPGVPVLVLGATADEIKGLAVLFERPAETIKVDGKVDKEVVTKHFVAIKNKLRTTTNKK